jgi:hypothetical protein
MKKKEPDGEVVKLMAFIAKNTSELIHQKRLDTFSIKFSIDGREFELKLEEHKLESKKYRPWEWMKKSYWS